MIEFQIEKVKNLKESAGTDPTLLEHNTRFLFRELCDVVLELLAREKEREVQKEKEEDKEAGEKLLHPLR